MKVINIFNNNEVDLGSFSDDRGSIFDVFYNRNVNHCCWITSQEGSERGNHFHLITTQYSLVVEGIFQYAWLPKGEVTPSILEISRGDLVISPPEEAHCLKALSSGIFLAWAEGLRGGRDYEADTYRVPSLFERSLNVRID